MKLRFLHIFSTKNISVSVLLLMTILLADISSFAQEGDSDLYIFGAVKDYETRRKLEGCIVSVFVGSSVVETYTTNKNGKFEFFLTLDKAYKIEFKNSEYVTKHLSVDVDNIPQEDRRAGFSLGPMDMSLFKPIDGIDFSMLDEPIGKAKYNGERGAVEWDDAYTASMLNAISKMMSDYEKAKRDELKADDKDAKELARKQAEFDKLVADGDGGVRNKDFKMGVTKYQAALVLFSDKPDVKAKLDDAQIKLDEQNRLANLDKEYNAFIDKGDDNFDAKNYEEAVNQYKSALEVKAGESYPTDQITKAEAQLAKIKELKAKEEEITNLMTDGDKAISENKFEEGISKYEQILKIDADNKEADTKLDAAYKSQEAFEAEAKTRAEYDAAIATADTAFESKDYESAISGYNKASSLMPKEDYPKTKALESQDKLNELLDAEAKAKEMEKIQAEFAVLVADADELSANENFDEAIEKYDEALNLLTEKNQDVEAKKQSAIDGRDRLKAEAKAGEEFAAAIEQADELMEAKDFKKAIEVYKEAIVIQDDQYPKDKIAEAESALKDIEDQEAAALEAEERQREEEARNLERQRLFDEYMSAGESSSNDKDFEKAIENFKGALGIIEGDKQASNMLAQAEQDLESQRANMAEEERKRIEEEERLAALAAEEEIENQFSALVEEGDKALNDKSYVSAIEKYEEALTIKKDKQVSKKIKDAERAMADDEKAREDAERLAEEERLRQEALDAEQALLDEEARLEAERLAEEARKRQQAEDEEKAIKDAETAEREKYLGYVKDGDEAFAGKDYRKSLRNFENAKEMRPEEKYPASRIEKLLALIEQQEEDERRANERAEKRRLREEQASFARGNDLNSSEESKIDNEIAQMRKERDEARWQAMEDYKQGLKDAQAKYQQSDNKQLEISQDEMAAIKDREKKTREDASSRHKDHSRDMKGYKEDLEANNRRMSEKHDNRIEENIEELAKLKTFSKDYENSEAYANMVESNEQKIKDAKAFQVKMKSEGQAKTEQTHQEINDLKNKFQGQNETLVKKEREKIRNSAEYATNLKKNIDEFNAKGTAQQQENAENINAQMEIYKNQEIARINAAKNDRESNYDALQDIETHTGNKDPMSYGETSLSSKYPQGVTEEKSNDGKNIVLRRIVVVGNKAVEYKKVTSVSGTFYFKDGISTSKYVWDIESKQVLD